jgi:hypothetical protein
VKKNAVSVLFALVLAAPVAAAQQPAPAISGGISGHVLYPDGTPSEGATVTAVTECKDMGYNLEAEAKTSNDGSFYIPPFLKANCNRVRLSAEKKEDLWLKTGKDRFDFAENNGTIPDLEVPRSGQPVAMELSLGNRGASITLQVRDTSSGGLIYVLFGLEKTSRPAESSGYVMFATGNDGSPDTLLLPAGQYQVSILSCACGQKIYSPMPEPKIALTLEAGQRYTREVPLNVRLTKNGYSYDNPRRKPCNP